MTGPSRDDWRDRMWRGLDWKLVLSLAALGLVLVVGFALVQQKHVIDQRGRALRTALASLSSVQRTAEENARTLAAFQREWAARSRQAEHQRDRLERQNRALAQFLRDHGFAITLPELPPLFGAGDAGDHHGSGGGDQHSPVQSPSPRPPRPTPSPGPSPSPTCVVLLTQVCLPPLP